MKKSDFMQWLVRLIKKDRQLFESDIGIKKQIYNKVQNKLRKCNKLLIKPIGEKNER